MDFAKLISLVVKWWPQIAAVLSALAAAFGAAHFQQHATAAELAPLIPDGSLVVGPSVPWQAWGGGIAALLLALSGGKAASATATPSVGGADIAGTITPLAKSITTRFLGIDLSPESIDELVAAEVQAIQSAGKIAKNELARRVAK